MRYIFLIITLSAIAGFASADVLHMGGTRNADGTWNGLASVETVPVGNVNNAADASTGYGSVDHAYNIGKYEVTAGQYCEFLNAKAKTDPYQLYNPFMWTVSQGCKIQQTGDSASYTYSVAADWANRPVNYVSFWDAARFTNWLCNGQGDGDTETGAYTLNGYNSDDGRTIVKNVDAQWWIPSDNEWYKAAYHNGGGAATDYFLYPTSSNLTPTNVLGNPTDPGNNATFLDTSTPGFFTAGSLYRRTEVGSHENSESPYGTFDQGGNVFEWTDSIPYYSRRGMRGGAYDAPVDNLASSVWGHNLPTYEITYFGFRVASVPEPSTFALLLSIAVAGLLGWRRRKGWL